MNQPIEPSMSKLDEILQDMCNTVFQHGQATRTYIPFHEGTPMEDAKQAILQWVNDEVIGKDRVPAFKNGKIVGNHNEFSSNMSDSAVFGSGYNTAKGEQRDILKQHGWKGDGDV